MLRERIGNAVRKRPDLSCLAVLVALCVLMFFDVLVTKDQVLSFPNTDVAAEFFEWRRFGFSELRAGHLVLWNPHIYAGQPYFAGFQSALVYPLNAVFLVLPIVNAINASFALHVLLAGVTAYYWLSRTGIRRPAALMGAVLYMFGGSVFYQIFGGHLPIVNLIAWTPLLFYALDRAREGRPFGRTVALGGLAVGMQILAGHPQFVYNTGLAVAVIVLFSKERWRVARAAAVMYLLGVMLSAVQLLPGLEAARENARIGGTPLEFAAIYPMTPESFLLWLVPGLFGDIVHFPRWVRWLHWEMVHYIGVAGLMLAFFAWTRRETPRRLATAGVVFVLIVFAVGDLTPVFRLMHDWLPGFGSFRGASKFMHLAMLQLVWLAGWGADACLRGVKPGRRFVAALFGVVLLLAAAAFYLLAFDQSDPVGPWARFAQYMADLPPKNVLPGPTFFPAAAAAAGRGLALAALLGAASLGLLLAGARWRAARGALLALAMLDVLFFASQIRATYTEDKSVAEAMRPILEGDPTAGRTFWPDRSNIAMQLGASDIWGYDPNLSRRYADFIAATQGLDPSAGSQNLELGKVSPLYTMLRLKWAWELQDDGTIKQAVVPTPMPKLRLVSDLRVRPGRDEALKALLEPGFNPWQTVVLETRPDPLPNPLVRDPGSARVIAETSEMLEIEADAAAPTVLLITDAYSRNWHAEALAGSSQKAYELLPADYVLRGVPLRAGHHHLRVYFAYDTMRPGWLLSACGALGILGCAVVRRRGDGRWPKAPPPLTPAQEAARQAYMRLWHQLYPQRFSFIERALQRAVAAYGPAGAGKTLEIGAGMGAHLAYEDLAAQEYHCLELRADFCADLGARLPAERIHQGDIQRPTPWPARRFDRVIAINVLEHLADLPAALAEIARLLADDGVLDIIIPCEGGAAYALARKISGERVFRKHFKMDYTPIIRNEHVSTYPEIVAAIERLFEVEQGRYLPLGLVPAYDANLLWSGRYRKVR